MLEMRRTTRFAAAPVPGFLLAAALLALGPGIAHAQAEGADGRDEVFVGRELEEYLRLLQTAGRTAWYPWSIRGFSPRELDRLAPADSAHPWADRYPLRARGGAPRLSLVAPRVEVFYNSAFPYGSNDGAVWAGRGLTASLEAGIAGRWGPLSLVLAPRVFQAQNAEFPLAVALADTGRFVYADQRFADYVHTLIDLPQRFGDASYRRVDPGQSTLRLDLPFVTLGASTADQHWGPAAEHPIVLGNNAGGYPHLFAGTSAPVPVGIGAVHGRVVWGRLEQSDWSRVTGRGERRFMSGVVGVFTPRGLPGLELGASRFFHQTWPEGGLGADDFLRPFQGFLKSGLPDQTDDELEDDRKSDPQNQLASVFARWVFPRGGFELYGEYGREDHNVDARDFILVPDHDAAYTLGFRKAWARSPERLVSLRGEVLNSRPSHLTQVRNQLPFYTHGATKQGHTLRGQILGSAAGYGGGGALLAVDYHHPRGRWTAGWSQVVREEDWRRLERHPDGGARAEGEYVASTVDAMHALGAEALLFVGRFDVTAGLTGVYNLNRDLQSDVFNLNASITVRVGVD